jgi:hypothetical protein
MNRRWPASIQPTEFPCTTKQSVIPWTRARRSYSDSLPPHVRRSPSAQALAGFAGFLSAPRTFLLLGSNLLPTPFTRVKMRRGLAPGSRAGCPGCDRGRGSSTH